MMPLGKAMRLRTGGNYLLFILTIVAGGTMAHSLVPPTPGPLLVADQLGVNLAAMIVGGCVIGMFASSCGYLFACWLNGRMVIPLRESADVSLEELEQLSQRDESELPPVWLAVMPIVLPVVLITVATALDTYVKAGGEWAIAAQPYVKTIGDKNVALIIAAGIALGMVAWQTRKSRVRNCTSRSSRIGGRRGHHSNHCGRRGVRDNRTTMRHRRRDCKADIRY